jgi:hypothetical protein
MDLLKGTQLKGLTLPSSSRFGVAFRIHRSLLDSGGEFKSWNNLRPTLFAIYLQCLWRQERASATMASPTIKFKVFRATNGT